MPGADGAVAVLVAGADGPPRGARGTAGYALDPDLKGHLDDLTYEYRLGDAPR